VRGHERDVDVAGLPDRLAVVDGLQHGQLAGALLHDARDPVQVLGPLATGHPSPHAVEGGSGGGHRTVYIGRVSVHDLRQHLLGGRVDRLEAAARPRHERATDEQTVRRTDVHDGARLGRRCVLECHGQSSVK
jgi:hypothetical protein